MASFTPEVLEEAYRRGYFPMAEDDGEIGWYRPNPRAILPLERLHVSRSLARTIRRGGFELTFDRAFTGVMAGCAARPETWISADFFAVYGELHRRNKAHSGEVWVKGELAAGIYGVHLGAVFFAESMFHRVRDMSKVALVHLARHLRERGFHFMEVQYLTPHLAQFGVVEISHKEYMKRLKAALAASCHFT